MPAKRLKDLLLEKGLREAELKLVVRAFDIVGDIAIVKIRRELWDKRRIIAEALMEFHRFRSVVAVRGQTEELFRTRGFESSQATKTWRLCIKSTAASSKSTFEGYFSHHAFPTSANGSQRKSGGTRPSSICSQGSAASQ